MLTSVLLWLYSGLLRLYPAGFYQQFADEMTDAFQLLLQDQPPLRTGLRELSLMPIAIVQEHHRRNTLWHMLLLLALPVLLGWGVLLLRPIPRFYLSYNLWLAFAGVCALILLVGWLLERGVTVLALPSLGFMLFIVYRLISPTFTSGSAAPLIVQIAAPAAVLALVLCIRRPQIPIRMWLPYLIALPLVGFGISLMVMVANGTFGQPLPELFRDYVLGALLPISTLSLLILAGLVFAPRHGSKAVLLLLGYLFFDLLGLSATLSNLSLQNSLGALYVLLFLLVMPLLVLRLPRYAGGSVLLAVALAYGLIFVIKASFYELDATFLLYRVNELLQTLIVLHVAKRVYARLERPAAIEPHAESTLTASPG